MADGGFVSVKTEAVPSPQTAPPPRAAGESGAPRADALAMFLLGSGITQSEEVANVLRGEQVHDPGSFLALDAEDVVELLATAKTKGVSVGDRAKLKALIRASGNTAVPETPRPSPRQPSQGIASLRAQFDNAVPQQLNEQSPASRHSTQPVSAPPSYSPVPEQQQQQQQPPQSQQHTQPQYRQQQRPDPPLTPTQASQWQAPPRTPYPAQHSSPPPAPQPPNPPPRDHPEPGVGAAPAGIPRSPFRNPFAGTSFAQANGFFEALMMMLSPVRSGAADLIDAMVVKYVAPVLQGRGLQAFGYGGPGDSSRQLWINSTMPRLLLIYGIFRGFVAMTTRVDSMMAFFIGFFLRKRDRISAPQEQQQQQQQQQQQPQY